MSCDHDVVGQPEHGEMVDGWQHPPSFYCPISRRVMHDPVVLADGHTYERRHIERWLQQHNLSPVSGVQLEQKAVFPNHALRSAIEEYFQQIFSVHQRAIRSSISAPEAHWSLGSNASLLRTIDALMECSLLVNADLSTEATLRRIMNEAKMLVGAEVASVFLLDVERKELYSTVNSTSKELRIPVTTGIAGHVATSGEPVIVHDAYSDVRFSKIVDTETGFKTHNMMCVPLKVKKGGIIGVVQLLNKEPLENPSVRGLGHEASNSKDHFTADDLQFLQVFASQAATAIASNSALDEQQVRMPGSPKDCCRSAISFAKWLFSSRKTVELCPARKEMHEPEEVVAPTAKEYCTRHCQESYPSNDVQCCVGLAAQVPVLLADAFESWHFDAFALAEATGNRPLCSLAEYLFQRLGLVSHFKLDQDKLVHFFDEIERGYDDGNHYHNRVHAATVLHAVHALLQRGGLLAPASAVLAEEPLVRMACLLAAAIHDFEHRGFSNDFLVRTADEWAVRYNDQHVNEQHHVAAAFAVLRQPECNFLEQLPAEDFRKLRSITIDLVIATDMCSNSQIVESMTQVLNDAHGADPDEAGGPPRAFVPTATADALLLLQLAVKCADIGHLALPWQVHVKWVKCLEEEFFAQGDKEKELNLPVSFLMDREKPGASETQVGFFEAVVIPIFRTLVRALPEASPVLDAVMANYGHWLQFQEAKADTAKQRLN